MPQVDDLLSQKFDPSQIDVFDVPAVISPNNPTLTNLTVQWQGVLDPVAGTVTTYPQHVIPQNAGQVGIVTVLHFK